MNPVVIHIINIKTQLISAELTFDGTTLESDTAKFDTLIDFYRAQGKSDKAIAKKLSGWTNGVEAASVISGEI